MLVSPYDIAAQRLPKDPKPDQELLDALRRDADSAEIVFVFVKCHMDMNPKAVVLPSLLL